MGVWVLAKGPTCVSETGVFIGGRPFLTVTKRRDRSQPISTVAVLQWSTDFLKRFAVFADQEDVFKHKLYSNYYISRPTECATLSK